MDIIYLEEAIADMAWFRRYYATAFPEGRPNARKQLRAVEELIKSSPRVGKADQEFADVYEFPIPRIPFTILYRVKPQHIEVLRVFDQRSEYSNTRGR